jgi:hypothetical protein
MVCHFVREWVAAPLPVAVRSTASSAIVSRTAPGSGAFTSKFGILFRVSIFNHSKSDYFI